MRYQVSIPFSMYRPGFITVFSICVVLSKLVILGGRKSVTETQLRPVDAKVSGMSVCAAPPLLCNSRQAAGRKFLLLIAYHPTCGSQLGRVLLTAAERPVEVSVLHQVAVIKHRQASVGEGISNIMEAHAKSLCRVVPGSDSTFFVGHPADVPVHRLLTRCGYRAFIKMIPAPAAKLLLKLQRNVRPATSHALPSGHLVPNAGHA